MSSPRPLSFPPPPSLAALPDGPTPRPVRIGVLTVSDTRTAADDTSGDTLVRAAEAAGHAMAGRAIVRDEIAAIQSAVKDLMAAGAEVVLTTGGTGVTGRDVTIEALEPLLTRPVEGFGELFRHLSYYDIGPSTMQSRALAGIIGTTWVFALPGSTGACRLAWDGILRHQLDIRARPCNLVSLMPRLDEGAPAR
jgi:molybdenum cofactor biosynthesis protein B